MQDKESYGEWEVIEHIDDDYCKCRCSCGKVITVLKYALTEGISKSCGHDSTSFINIAGQKFYELTAIKCIDRKNRTWQWLCSCGELCKGRKNDVMNGKKKSCGHIAGRGNNDFIKKGTRFHEWEVIEKIDPLHCLCKCSCGKTKPVSIYDLKNDRSKSCGHVTKGTNENGRKDMPKKIGEWSIGDYLGDGYYECTCSCGEVKKLKGTYLRTGQSKSCGHSTNRFEDLKDRIFGDWTVKKYLGNYKWLCECSCGQIKPVSRYDLIMYRSTSCGHGILNNLSGKTFGFLKLDEYLGHYKYRCTCTRCNTQKIVAKSNILSGNTISCGCYSIEQASKKKINKEDFLKTVNDYIIKNEVKPLAFNIAEILNVHEATINSYIKEYNVQDKFDYTFGSRYEKEIYDILNLYTEVEIHNRKILGGKELDLYLSEYNIAIEFNGTYWHSEINRPDMYYHRLKTEECNKNNIRLIHIFEHEWKDKYTREKLLNMLNNIINDSRKTVYARDAEIKQVNTEDAKDFLNEYHLQDYAQSSINLGCYYNNELIGVMTFGTPRFNNKYQYELIRLCWKDDVKVVGGSEKLFSHFIKQYNPDSIISYCDISKFTGQVYSKLGFKLDGLTEPNYKWVSSDSETVMSRYETIKHKLVSSGLGTEEQSETEIMTSLDFYKIYDCGNYRYIWTNTENK